MGPAAWKFPRRRTDVNVTTIGVGNGINNARLQDVDLDGSGAPSRSRDFDELIDTLLAVVGGDVSGNVILGNNNALGGGDDDAFGADGGRIESVTINNITYVWNGTNVIDPSGPGANIAGNQLTGIATAAGGKLTFNFATGAWSYTAPINGVSANTTETFAYTLIDGDGDHANANLQVTVLNVNNAPVNTVPGAQSTNEDVSKVITGLSVADSDAGSGSITVTLSVTERHLERRRRHGHDRRQRHRHGYADGHARGHQFHARRGECRHLRPDRQL